MCARPFGSHALERPLGLFEVTKRDWSSSARWAPEGAGKWRRGGFQPGLRQIVVNLVGNAHQVHRRGGEGRSEGFESTHKEGRRFVSCIFGRFRTTGVGIPSGKKTEVDL